MTPTLRRKLEALAERREELQHLLSDPDVVNNNDRFRTLSRELSQLEPVAVALEDEARAKADLSAAEAMRNDPEMRELAEEEIAAAQARLEELDAQLALLLVPRDPRDDGNLFLKYAPVPAATRRRSLPATCSACTRAMPSARAGRWKSNPTAPASTAATRKWWHGWSDAARIRG